LDEGVVEQESDSEGCGDDWDEDEEERKDSIMTIIPDEEGMD